MRLSGKKNGFLQSLNMKFMDASLESEYLAIQNKNQSADFKVTIIVLIFVILVTTIKAIIELEIEEIISSTIFLAVLVILFSVRNRFSARRNHLILISIFLYNLYRLAALIEGDDESSDPSFFYSGYVYGVLQIILLSRVHNIHHRILAVVVCFASRFGLIIGFIEQANLDIASLIRHVIVDIFIIYFFYSQEKMTRRIFMDFCDERNELTRFRELLEDYLPQCVTILDYSTNQPLFSNKAFLNAFESEHSENGSPLLNPSQKPNLNSLQVEEGSVRNIEDPHANLGYFNLSGTLKDVIMRTTGNSIISYNALSLRAYRIIQEETQSFQIIIKKMQWDKNDTIAIILHETTVQEKIMTLKIANQNKDKVIATVAHELRTPLNGIIGLLNMAIDKVTHPEALKYMSYSKDNARLLLSLVNSHLDLQQIKAGRLTLNPSKIDLNKVIGDVFQLLQFQTKQKGIYLEADIDQEVPTTITTDESRLKQILINLIGNAIKFTSTGGIKIEVSQNYEDSRCLQVCVVDTGRGIKEEDMGKLFQMYGRLDEGRSVNKNGVGLGLIISNILARMLGGVNNEKGIEVKSQYGVGTRFCFKLLKDLEALEIGKNELYQNQNMRNEVENLISEEMPAKEANEVGNGAEELYASGTLSDKLLTYSSYAKISLLDMTSGQNAYELDTPKMSQTICYSKFFEPRTETRTIESNYSSKNRKENYVLAVDDNPFNLLVIERQLKEMNFFVKTATDGQEAIEFVQSCARTGQMIKVILMDCQMPIMDGYETSRILTDMMKKGEVPETPIFALSAGSKDQDIGKCLESGMVGYLAKPLTKEDFLKEYDRFIEQL